MKMTGVWAIKSMLNKKVKKRKEKSFRSNDEEKSTDKDFLLQI